MSSFPLFHLTHAFHPHHRYLTTSHHLSPTLSHHQPVQWSVSTLLPSLENLSPPLSHLTSDICSIHPIQPTLVLLMIMTASLTWDILPHRLTVCLLNMSSHRIMLLHSENENFHKRHRILLFDIFSSKSWDFFAHRNLITFDIGKTNGLDSAGKVELSIVLLLFGIL